jgi:hypothetical protein
MQRVAGQGSVDDEVPCTSSNFRLQAVDQRKVQLQRLSCFRRQKTRLQDASMQGVGFAEEYHMIL